MIIQPRSVALFQAFLQYSTVLVMIQVFLERYQSDQISVSRKSRITENNTVSVNNVVQNSTIKNFLIVATDLTSTQHIEQD